MKKLYIILAAAFALTACSQSKTQETTGVSETPSEAVAATVRRIPANPDGTVHELSDPDLYSPDARVEGLTVLDFNAVWCGPCRQLSPVFEEMARKFEGKATFVSVNVDKYGQLMETYNLGQFIPVVLILRPDGKAIHFVGTDDLLPAEKFEKILQDQLRSSK